jgi:outer membrane protein OmpA-like peptidoglycan-associated protein
MATFDKLIQEIGSRYCLGPKASPLVEETLGLIKRQPGGIGGFVNRFKAAGFAVEVASWLGGPDPVPLSGQEVEQTLGSDVIRGIANKIGVSQRFARTILGYAIPKIIVLRAQDGAIPSAIRASASSFLDSAIPFSSSPVEEITQHGAEQIRPSRTEYSGAAAGLRPLLIPGAALLITLGLLLGYFIGAGDREAIQSAPIVAQNAPVPSPPGSQALFEGDAVTVGGAIPDADRDRIMSSLKSPLGPQVAFATISGVSGKNQVCAPNQSALKFPTIYFAANSADVLSSSNPLLRQAAGLIKQLPAGTLVEIRGYTHSIGSPTINMQLSQRRANAVRRALVHAGVDPAMLSAKGYGSSHSLASKNGTVEGRSNSMMEDRRRNDRRVEFSIAQQ